MATLHFIVNITQLRKYAQTVPCPYLKSGYAHVVNIHFSPQFYKGNCSIRNCSIEFKFLSQQVAICQLVCKQCIQTVTILTFAKNVIIQVRAKLCQAEASLITYVLTKVVFHLLYHSGHLQYRDHPHFCGHLHF